MSSTVRNAEEKVQKERRNNLLVLVREFLVEEGYVDTLKSFESETRLSKEQVLCDNVDLGTIVEDFESYYYLRFKKYPKISRKVSAGGDVVSTNCGKRKTFAGKINPEPVKVSDVESSIDNDFLRVESIGGKGDNVYKVDASKVWRGLGVFEGYSEEWKLFADIIAREVIDKNLNVTWDSVVGLDEAKQHLREAIVYPMKHPSLFDGGIMSPWKGLLLYGPSGTGKTLLAKAVATECSTTFFNISASSLVSKWRGESEKLVRVMFELARHQAPSTIFIDEVDALASRRDCPTEHEASRRLKSEFLVQLDGLLCSTENVFLLTTTNLPWDLDPAMLRRFEKKIFVNLPNESDRFLLFKTFLPTEINQHINTDVDYATLANHSSAYSGAEIKLVCKEALIGVARSLVDDLEHRMNMSNKTIGKLRVRLYSPGRATLSTGQVLEVLRRLNPVNKGLHKFTDWLK